MLIPTPAVALIRLCLALRILLCLSEILDALLEHLIRCDHIGVLLLELLHLLLQLFNLVHAPVVP